MGDLETPDAVVVHRTVAASDPASLTEELTAFALEHGLHLDRRYTGDGMKFVPQKDAEVEGEALFRSGDELLVILAPSAHGTDVTLTATMLGLHQRGEDWKRGRRIRGVALSGLFAYLGVRGLAHPEIGDAVMIGLSALFLRRTFRAVGHESEDRAAFEDNVHDTLVELCLRLDGAD